MHSTLAEMLERIKMMDPATKAEMTQLVMAKTNDALWLPTIGPQLSAYDSKADLLLYGGAGGGGKTDLLAGLSLMEHKRTLLLRPQYTDLGALIDRVCRVAGTRSGLNSSPPAQFKFGERIIDFGAANNLERAETWQGNPHDLIGFDEACQFPEEVIRFLLGWNRAADEDLDHKSTQRVRAVLATNPPLTSEGAWIVQMFGPWLDPTHPDPAEHGELRWYISDEDGKDVAVDGPEPVEYNGRTNYPKSRTFIPAALTDNPFLADTGYQATLDAMPEPMRSAIRDGNFMAAREDDAFQVIPSAWVVAAQQRWRDNPKPNIAMSAIGLDVARGGRDDTVFAPRWGSWFGELTIVPGRNTPDGSSVAVLAAGMLREGAVVGVDNIGIGADAETALKNAGLPFEAMNGAEKATAHTRDGAFTFATRRSEMWWMLREALDPDHGYDVSLPVDPQLQADLPAPTYEVRPGQPPRIYVESKKDIMKRLSRSPDRGDAIVYAWNAGGLDPEPLRNRRGSRTLSVPAPVSDYDVLRA